MSDVQGAGAVYSEVQCIMGNGHMGTPSPCEQTDRQTRVKTSLADGKNKEYFGQRREGRFYPPKCSNYCY